jgi:hypothetical protein
MSRNLTFFINVLSSQTFRSQPGIFVDHTEQLTAGYRAAVNRSVISTEPSGMTVIKLACFILPPREQNPKPRLLALFAETHSTRFPKSAIVCFYFNPKKRKGNTMLDSVNLSLHAVRSSKRDYS